MGTACVCESALIALLSRYGENILHEPVQSRNQGKELIYIACVVGYWSQQGTVGFPQSKRLPRSTANSTVSNSSLCILYVDHDIAVDQGSIPVMRKYFLLPPRDVPETHRLGVNTAEASRLLFASVS
jgi:hypothetical protein